MYSSLLKMPTQTCLVFLDTQRERDIKLGNQYKFDPLTASECNINEKQKENLQISEGDLVYISAPVGNLLNAIILKYNTNNKN